jgi:Protein of unknown function (DUF3224)
MSQRVQAQFEVTSWEEQPFDEREGAAKLTEAQVAKTYSGDIEGTSATRWLMAYAPDESAAFVGVERITGTVAGKNGTLVLQHVGKFEDGAAKATLTVLSGTDELADASGSGDFLADPAGSVTLGLDLR